MNRRKILWMVATCLISLSLIMASCGKAATTTSATTPAVVTFEQKRTDVIRYLRALNDINYSASSAALTIVYPSSVYTAADLIAWNAAMTKSLTVMDGAIRRLAELKPSSLETSTITLHQQYSSMYQSARTLMKAEGDAMAVGDAAGVLQKRKELASLSSLNSLNRAVEQLMLQYNISDAEAYYFFRVK